MSAAILSMSQREFERAALRKIRERISYRWRYRDFGPTLAWEKLGELHGVHVSRETLRHWMTEDGLWVPSKRLRGYIEHFGKPVAFYSDKAGVSHVNAN